MSHSWKTLAEIFDAAAKLSAEERSRFLAVRCERDGELREVESLLEQDALVGDFLIPPYSWKPVASDKDEPIQGTRFD